MIGRENILIVEKCLIISQSVIDTIAAEIVDRIETEYLKNIEYSFEGDDYTLTVSANIDIIESTDGDGITTPKEKYISHAHVGIVGWDCTDEDSISFKEDVELNTQLLELEIECRLLKQVA